MNWLSWLAIHYLIGIVFFVCPPMDVNAKYSYNCILQLQKEVRNITYHRPYPANFIIARMIFYKNVVSDLC